MITDLSVPAVKRYLLDQKAHHAERILEPSMELVEDVQPLSSTGASEGGFASL